MRLRLHPGTAVILILAAVAAGWAAILYVAGDPARGLGEAWFELTLAQFGVTYLALLACYVILGRGQWKRRLARAALSVAALGLAAALVELPALVGLVDYRRMLDPKSLGGTGPHNRQLDPELVYRHLPHDHFVHRQAGDYAAGMAIPTRRRYAADCQYDGNGFRNAEDYDRAAVVLLGDSLVEGYNVTQDEICSVQLAKLLGQPVCNLALCGYGPQQELAALRRYGLPLRPDVVVWVFYEGNDLSDIEEYERVMADWPACVASEDCYAARSFFLNALDPLGFWLDQLRWRESAFARRRAGRLRAEVPGETRVTYIGNPPFGTDEGVLARLGKLEAMLEQAREECDQRGIRFLVVNAPTKGRVYRDLCEYSADSDVPQWQFNDIPQRLGAWCKSAGIAYLDLTAPLQSAARQGKLVYLVDDPHWTGEGHAVVAAEIANVIGAMGR